MASSISQDRLFICVPPLGRLGSRTDSSDTSPRPFVDRKGHKKGHSLQFALQILRWNQRIGKHHTEEQWNERLLELHFSRYRRDLDQIETDGKALSLGPEEIYKAKNDIQLQLFTTLKVSGLKLWAYRALSFADTTTAFREWDRLTQQVQHTVHSYFVEALAVKRFKCAFSSWTPKDNFNQFYDELTGRGPLMVTGKFGLSFYIHRGNRTHHPMECYKQFEKPIPKVLELLGEKRKINSLPESARCTSQSNDHAIVLVGAEKEGLNNFVYYLDPAEDSSVTQGETVYRISYFALQNHCRPFIPHVNANTWRQLLSEKPENRARYAVYNPLKI